MGKGEGYGDKSFICLATCCGVLFLTSVILFAVSFSTLDPAEMGIMYNNNLLTIDEEHGAYSNGRYFLGLGLSFVRFPSTLVPAEFTGDHAFNAWSKEGQTMTLELGFYYRLDRGKLVDIYKRYALEYHSRMLQIALRVVKQVTIQYLATEFFSNRTFIGDHMARDLRVSMKDEDMIVELFALRSIEIPEAFEAKVQSKVVTLQAAKTAGFKKDTAIARAAIAVMEGNGYAIINKTLAQASANAILTVETARADGIRLYGQTEADAYQQLSSVLSLAPGPLLKYRWSQILAKLQETTTTIPDRKLAVAVGFDAAALKFGP